MDKYSCDSTLKLKKDYFVIYKYFYCGQPFKIVEPYSDLKAPTSGFSKTKNHTLKKPLNKSIVNFTILSETYIAFE